MSSSPLRVLVDARRHRPFRTGISRYVEELSLALKDRCDIEFALGVTPSGSANAFASSNAIQVIELPPETSRFQMPPRFDVFHATYPLIRPPRSSPLVVTIHDLIYDYPEWAPPWKRFVFRYWTQSIVGAADAVITVSHFTQQELLSRRRVTARTFVAQNGVRGFSPPDAKPESRQRYFLFVGNLRRHKGFRTLLHALEFARDARLVVATSEFGAHWKRETSGIDASVLARVELVPSPSDEALVGLVRGALAVVIPSFIEGFGLPVLEAMSIGTTVVCSDIPVFREVAGDCAEYFIPGDEKSLAASLSKLMSWPTVPRKATPCSGIAQKFSWEVAASVTADAYRAAVKHREG